MTSSAPSIRVFQAKVTFACNLSCPGCYAQRGVKEKAEITPEEMLECASLLREDPRARIQHFYFHGGEPTIAGKEKLNQLLQALQEGLGYRPPSLGITSNLAYEDDSLNEFFDKEGVKVSTSFDLHRNLPEAFYSNAKTLAQAGALKGILTVLSASLDPEKYVRELLKAMDKIGRVIPVKLERFVQPQLGPFRQERNDLVFSVYLRVKRLLEREGIPLYMKTLPQDGAMAILCSWRCFTHSISFLPKGRLALCSKAPLSTVIGTLKTLKEQRSSVSQLIGTSAPYRLRLKREKALGETCRACVYRDICGKGCIWQPLENNNQCPMFPEILLGGQE